MFHGKAMEALDFQMKSCWYKTTVLLHNICAFLLHWILFQTGGKLTNPLLDFSLGVVSV